MIWPWQADPTGPLRQLLADTQEVVRNKVAELASWQDHAGKLLADTEHARREAEHWRGQYEQALEANAREREKLVQHLVELKREGFGTGSSLAIASANLPEPFPPEIERAISQRSFDANVTQANRQYATEQLRVRPDDAATIAKEILRGERVLDAWGDGEGLEEVA
jgi:hypothetical protein